MSRFSRHLLNATLLFVAISGQFTLNEFVQIIASQKELKKLLRDLYEVLINVCCIILINSAQNIRGLTSPLRGTFVAALWLTSGHPCEFCDSLYKAYRSVPSNGKFGRLWNFITLKKHMFFYTVIGFNVLRLAAQWGVFWLFYILHRSPDSIRPKKDNCTVIIPTADTELQRVEECLTSCLLNKVKEVIVVTTRSGFAETENVMDGFRKHFPKTTIRVLGTAKTRKCDMITEGIRFVETDIVVLVDPNVFWPYHFLDRLLFSFNQRVGFAMIHQRVRRFKLPFIEVSPRVADTQSEPRIGLSLGEHAARAIACSRALLQHPDFRRAFSGAQPTGSASYDEDHAALFLEGWALKKGCNIAEGYAGHDAFEPPLRTTPESAVWTHRLFTCVRYARQAMRLRFADKLVTATGWDNLPSVARGSHASAFLILAFVVDAALAILVWCSPHRIEEKLQILGGAMTGYGIKMQVPYFVWKEQVPETLWYPLFVWSHGLIKRWAGRNDSVGQSPRQNESTDHDAFDRLSATSTRSNDPFQRLLNSPSYRPTSVPLSPRQRAQTVRFDDGGSILPSIEQPSRAQSFSPISQTRQGSPYSIPNTPSERSHLRQEISRDIHGSQGSQGSSRSSSRHEEQPWSRTPSPRTQAPPIPPENINQSPPAPSSGPSRSDRRKRTARKPTSYDADFHPSGYDSNSDDSLSSASESHADPVEESRPRFRTPNFTPSRPSSRAATPSRSFGPVPELPMPRQSLVPRRRTVKADAVGEPAHTSTVPSTMNPVPQLRAPNFTPSKPGSKAASPVSRSLARSKAKRTAPKPVVVSPRKTRCPKCRRLHEGECLEE